MKRIALATQGHRTQIAGAAQFAYTKGQSLYAGARSQVSPAMLTLVATLVIAVIGVVRFGVAPLRMVNLLAGTAILIIGVRTLLALRRAPRVRTLFYEFSALLIGVSFVAVGLFILTL